MSLPNMSDKIQQVIKQSLFCLDMTTISFSNLGNEGFLNTPFNVFFSQIISKATLILGQFSNQIEI